MWRGGVGYHRNEQTGFIPIYVSTVFSMYFPFQIEYTDWKVIQSDVSSDWNTTSKVLTYITYKLKATTVTNMVLQP